MRPIYRANRLHCLQMRGCDQSCRRGPLTLANLPNAQLGTSIRRRPLLLLTTRSKAWFPQECSAAPMLLQDLPRMPTPPQ